MKTRQKRTKQIKRKRTKRMGGANIQAVIGKLHAIKDFMKPLPPDMPELDVVHAIEEKFGELLHVKSAASRYPTVVEHLANLELLLDLFDKKYSGKDTEAHHDSSSYQQQELYPSGCLDAQLDWLTGFLIGPDPGITVHNKNSRISLVIQRKLVELKVFLKTSPSRKEYEFKCNTGAVLSEITNNPDIMMAIKKGIIDIEEVKDIFDSTAIDYFENSLFNDGETSIPEATEELIEITKVPLVILSEGSQLFTADNKLIGTVRYNHHYAYFINVVLPNGELPPYPIRLEVGMKYR
jgi:hypothetical protein